LLCWALYLGGQHRAGRGQLAEFEEKYIFIWIDILCDIKGNFLSVTANGRTYLNADWNKQIESCDPRDKKSCNE
jgi:hypothetical protein